MRIFNEELFIMKTLGRIFVLIIFPYMLMACKGSEVKTDRGELIVIDNFENKELNLGDYVENIQTFKIETDSFIVGEIKDLCVYDSILFFVDGQTMNIVAYDLPKRSIKHCINMKGNGPFEYVNPHALSVDEHYLYLLDSSTQKIICYSHNLEPQREIRLNFSAFDILRVDKGFLLCAVLPEPSLDYKKVIYVDMNGEILNSFIHTHQYGMTFGKSILMSGDNNVYINIPYSNQIYEWKDESLCGYCYIDFGKFNIPQESRTVDMSFYGSDYIYNNNFFVTSSYFINAFLYNDRLYYHLKKLETDELCSGIMKNDISELPFFPRWQYKDCLIGLCRMDELSTVDNVNTEKVGLYALFFKMK